MTVRSQKPLCRVLVTLAGVLIAGTIATAVAFAVSWALIEWDDDAAAAYPGGLVLRDSADEVMRVSLGPGDVDCRPYYAASANDWIVKALVAAEDGAYWTHCGVRPLSILRAAFQNLFYARRVSGASTITMQVVRLVKPHPKSYFEKCLEAIRALKLERRHDKLWILSQYLNRAPYGSNFIGIEAAAQGWFGKRAKELGPGEAALLAGIVQAPSRLRPDRALDLALKRREYVLRRMFDLGYLTARQRQGAADVLPELRRAPRPFRHPFACDYITAHLAATGVTNGDVRTTLDADLQMRCEELVNRASAQGGHAVAAVVLRVGTGDLLAMACSGDYFSPAAGGQVNTALASRPAGSTLKPLLAALAMDFGHVTPETRLADLPRAYRGYRPSNFDNSFRGLVTLSDALVLSLNLPFVQLVQRTGIESFGASLRALGFSHLGAPDESFGLGMAIGNVEITLLELASAYAAVARGGEYLQARSWEGETRPPARRVFSPGACYLVSDILSDDRRSSAALGHVADVERPRFAWKTGTSAAYRDAWTVLWNPDYTVAVWCGHLRGGFGDASLVGAKAAAPLAWRLARTLYPNGRSPWFTLPDTVGERTVCALTGLPANGDCPRTETGRFLRGSSSPALCQVHVRNAEGEVIEHTDAYLSAFTGAADRANALSIASPQDGEKFMLVPGVPQQEIVCKPMGNVKGGRLWWFVDGMPAGETTGASPFSVRLGAGEHRIVCSTADGVNASVTITVKQQETDEQETDERL